MTTQDDPNRFFKGLYSALLLAGIIWLFLIIFFSCSVHRPRYDRYDKRGLIKGEPEFTLDKTKGKKVKPMKK